jgi:tellurite resistance protein
MGLLDFFFKSKSKVPDKLTGPQFEAVAEVIAFIGYGDGEFTDAEVDELGDALDETPWCESLNDAELDKHMHAAFGAARKLSELPAGDAGIAAELNRLAAQLPHAELKERVLSMGFAVSLVDGVINLREQAALDAVAAAFAIPKDRVQALMAQVQGRIHA